MHRSPEACAVDNFPSCYSSVISSRASRGAVEHELHRSFENRSRTRDGAHLLRGITSIDPFSNG